MKQANKDMSLLTSYLITKLQEENSHLANFKFYNNGLNLKIGFRFKSKNWSSFEYVKYTNINLTTDSELDNEIKHEDHLIINFGETKPKIFELKTFLDLVLEIQKNYELEKIKFEYNEKKDSRMLELEDQKKQFHQNNDRHRAIALAEMSSKWDHYSTAEKTKIFDDIIKEFS